MWRGNGLYYFALWGQIISYVELLFQFKNLITQNGHLAVAERMSIAQPRVHRAVQRREILAAAPYYT
jgi:hypothetical protein